MTARHRALGSRRARSRSITPRRRHCLSTIHNPSSEESPMLNALWNPTVVGEIPLPHRLAMAP